MYRRVSLAVYGYAESRATSRESANRASAAEAFPLCTGESICYCDERPASTARVTTEFVERKNQTDWFRDALFKGSTIAMSGLPTFRRCFLFASIIQQRATSTSLALE